MNRSQILPLVFALTLFSPTAFADKQTEAASMIERARQLSGIRAEGAPGFRLKLSFTATNEKGAALEGTYTEVWATRTQWRREIVAGDFRRTVVAAGKERWLLESGKSSLEQVQDLPALSEIGRFQPQAWTSERIKTRKLNGSSVRCVEIVSDVRTLAGSTGGTYALCFDSRGLLVADVAPSEKGSGGGDKSCFFFDYQGFGDRMLARSYKCAEAGHTRLEAKIVELVAEPKAEPETFARPEGAKELTGCPDPATPPIVIHQPQSDFVGAGVVTISLVVGIDGAPHELSVVSSSDTKLEQRGLDYVRQWRFMPTTCDGEPKAVKIAVEVVGHR